jgi:hypothetical protein
MGGKKKNKFSRNRIRGMDWVYLAHINMVMILQDL